MSRWLITLASAAAVVLLGAYAAQSRSSRTSVSTDAHATPSLSSYGTAQRGGVYRTAVTSFGLTGGLDPDGRNPDRVRMGDLRRGQPHPRRLPAHPRRGRLGPRADLATSVPKPTDDGRTYTFHLKPGIKFGPPLNRAITSQDIEYAFQRINDATLVPQYGYYYDGADQGPHRQGEDA